MSLSTLSKTIAPLKVGSLERRTYIKLSYSVLGLSVLNVLRKNNFISGFQVKSTCFLVALKYFGSDCAITDIKFISRKSCRIFISYQELRYLLLKDRYRTFILFSAKFGCITSKDAIDFKTGGELIMRIN